VTINRRILVQVTLPAVLISLLLSGTCLVGVWSLHRLQTNRARLLSKDVRSLLAAQEMALRLRQLRIHGFLYHMDPVPARAQLVDRDNRQFQQALHTARELADQPREDSLIAVVEKGYRRYRAELELPTEKQPSRTDVADLLRWADTHPVRGLHATCGELLRINQEQMESTADESEAIVQQSRRTLILLGVLGPVGGVIGGFGVAWGLSRSITRLRVRLEDVHSHLGQEFGTVRLTGVGDLAQVDRLLDAIASRVREMAARYQQQQEELLRGEQLAAVGQLAAGVAHEVRNPLTSIKLLVGAALRGSPGRSLSAEDLQIIHDEVGRLEAKVQWLLDFTRPPETVREPADLRDLVHHALGLVQARIRQLDVQTDVRLPDEPVTVNLDRGQVTSVLSNLFRNALDAMPRGGRLSVTLRCEVGGSIQLTVTDTGPGIDRHLVGRPFTPFTSTKPTGTGLGLSISDRIVREHGGTLAGENPLEGGARFTITLPAPVRETCHADHPGH